jgi:hypothetical protein
MVWASFQWAHLDTRTIGRARILFLARKPKKATDSMVRVSSCALFQLQELIERAFPGVFGLACGLKFD